MKVTLIGGGSYSWTPVLFGNFFTNSFFGFETTLCLMDINERALADMYDYCTGINQLDPSKSIRLLKTMSLDEALNGADYVVVAISHGGEPAELEDHRIARRHNFYNLKGSEVGVAGASRTIRHVPELVRIAQKMKSLCPGAMLLNVSNPLTAITWAITWYTGVPAAGFCHGVCNHLELLLPYFGAQRLEDVDFVVAGVDHCSYLLEVKYQDQDALEIMRRRGLIEAAWHGKDNITFDDPFAGRENQRIRFILWDILGYLPAISDEHCGEFFYQAIGTDAARVTFGVQYDRIKERQQTIARARKTIQEKLGQGLFATPARAGEIIDRFIEALTGGRPLRDVLNYQNIGQIGELPREAVVETKCEVDSCGIHPVVVPSLPPILESIIRPLLLRERLYMEAAMEWNEQKLIAALATDPIVNDFSRVKAVAREIMEYNQNFIIK